MKPTNEQVQALKAAVDATPATEWKFHERHSLSHVGDGYVSIDGREAILCLSRPVGGIAHSCAVLRYIAAANPAAILSLLAERDADNALIDEQAKRIAELEKYAKNRDEENQGLMLTVGRLRIEREQASTLTVTLPQPEQWSICEVLLDKKKVIAAIRTACAAAGITLVVGE